MSKLCECPTCLWLGMDDLLVETNGELSCPTCYVKYDSSWGQS